MNTEDIETLAAEATLSRRDDRFGGIVRLYGAHDAARIRELHLCVVGVGGVGSWVAEALARTGVGAVTLMDGDTIEPGNVNRQIHALSGHFDRLKVETMAERIQDIHPACRCRAVADYLTERTLAAHLDAGYDAVIDAIDRIRVKAAMIAHCRAARIPVITTGGAGGRRDPTAVRVTDLSRTTQDPLAAKVRRRLREAHGFPRDAKRRFGVDCVYSLEQPLYPQADGGVSTRKPRVSGVSLDCRLGYGSVSFVTGTFGFVAAARAIATCLAASEG
jgi:tRNA A37 threonylcarbamoyladenosine dehydratase